jgi:peptidase A4-like protein
MRTRNKRGLQPSLEGIENRCLLSTAVLEILNQSSYIITFDFRWSSSSRWTNVTERPGQGEIFWTAYSTSLTPQVLYNTTTSAFSQTTVNLVQGYNEWPGTGPPPASAATLYEFVNAPTGVELSYSGSAPTPAPTPTPTPTPAPNPSQSSNWSGNAVETNFSQPQANSVSAVYGSWIVPTVSGSSSGKTYSVVWVGIDGYSDSTVEQIGTEQDVVNGTPVYSAWWEMYSAGNQQPEQPISSMTIEPGDSITASVQYITSGTYAGDFYLSIVDTSRANDSFSTYESSSATQSPSALRTSAEWIVEAPGVGSGVADLTNFGSVTFTNATAVINGVSGPIDSSSWQSEAINMVSSNGVAYDTTSVPTNSGTSFVVTYDSTAGAAVQKHNESASRPDFRAAHGGTPSSGVKIQSPALGRHSGLWSSRALIRQLKQSTAGFSIDHP